MNKKIKRSAFILGGLLGVCLVSAGVIFIVSMNAVSAFREGATEQLNPIISGDDLSEVSPVEISNIPLADLINPIYDKVKNQQDEYNNLFKNARKYGFVKKQQDQLVEIYNTNSDKNESLSADILSSVDTYLSVVKNNYPDEISRIEALQELSDLIATSTNFTEIADEFSDLIRDNTIWLNSLRDELNLEISNFQKAVN